MSDEPIYQPDPAAIAADLRDDHIHLDPAVAEVIGDEQLSAITTLVADADVPIYVLAVPLTARSELSYNQLVSLVHRELPEDGVYFVSQSSYDDQWRVAATSYGVSTDNEDNLATYVAVDLYPSDLGLQLEEAVEVFSGGNAREIYDEQLGERHSSTPEYSADSSQIFGIDTPVAVTGFVVLAVAVLIGVPLWRRRAARRGEVEVKRRALRRISSAQTEDWRHRAETWTAELGERIRTLQIESGADSQAWAAALDHYQAATAVLDRSANAADSVGAIVLAQRGDDALTHAVAGQDWAPAVVCFFNPLHGVATTTAAWETTAGRRKVPCCGSCRSDVRRRREPDILDLPTGSTVVHYMDSGDEPWASTGYGSLAPDLLDRLQIGPRD